MQTVQTIKPLDALATQRLARDLQRHVRGDVLFDSLSRLRHPIATTTGQRSYPVCVLAPLTETDAFLALDILREAGVKRAVAGQSMPQSPELTPFAVINTERHLNQILHLDPIRGSAVVQSGVKLAQLNAAAMVHGLCFPIGFNNPRMQQKSVGELVAHNYFNSAPTQLVRTVLGVDVVLAQGVEAYLGHFGLHAPALDNPTLRRLVSTLFELAARYESDIRSYFPKTGHIQGGCMVDIFYPGYPKRYTDDDRVNMSHLLLGSYARLAYIKRVHLKLMPIDAVARAHSQAAQQYYPDESRPFPKQLDALMQQIKQAFDVNNTFV